MATSHVTTSVGWLGAVLAFLVLGIAALFSQGVITTPGLYVAMNLIGWAVIMPLAGASFVSGIALAVGTDRGLLRHRWILVKFVATIVLLVGLVVHQVTAVSRAADLARDLGPGVSAVTAPLAHLSLQLVIDAGFAAVFLTGLTALSFIKPWGRTTLDSSPTLGASLRMSADQKAQRQMRNILIVIIALVLLAFIGLHVMGGAEHHGH